ncbi:MAG: hypothetical protein ACKOXF_00915 [Chitinophagaceae bacterium]
MNIEAITTELKSRMHASIERIHSGTNSMPSHGSANGSNYKAFKDDLYSTIFDLIEKHNLEFRNHEESKMFLDELKPTCEDLLTKYFLG